MSRAINENTGAILNTVDLNNEPSFEILGVLGTPPTSAPEPGTWGLLVGGLLPSQGASDAGQGALGTCDRGALGILTR